MRECASLTVATVVVTIPVTAGLLKHPKGILCSAAGQPVKWRANAMTLSWPGVRCSRYGHVSLTLVKRAAFTSAKDPNSGLEVQRPDKPQSNIDIPPLV